MTTEHIAPVARRKRGRSAGINTNRIVAAARSLDPANLTIQAVADELGVDRKAVSYHINDREGLLQLLAVDNFSRHFTPTTVPADADWREAIRITASSVKDSLIAAGTLATHFRLPPNTAGVIMEPAETVLERMIDAGFSDHDAGRSLALIVNIAMGYARDMVISSSEDGHPQQPELRHALEASDPTALGAIRHLTEINFNPYDELQFDYYIDILIGGLETRLNRTTKRV